VNAVATPVPGRRSLPQKAALGLEILRTYAVVRIRLRRHGLTPTLARLRAPLESKQGAATSDADLVLERAVRRTLAPLPTDTRCLTQALVLLGLLARRGVPTTLVLGVERTGARFGAHAWIEHAGRPLLQPGSDAERRLAEL
jgi:hypothetical protein